MAVDVKEMRLAHERDAAWLIALWLAIHGGDPAPKEGEVVSSRLQEAAALNAIAALAEGLDEVTRQAVVYALAPKKGQMEMHAVRPEAATKRLAALGIHITEQNVEQPHHTHAVVEADGPNRTPRFYCIRFRGQTYCVQLPDTGPHHIA